MKLRRINLLRRQTESFEEKSRGKTRCGGSGRWRDIPKSDLSEQSGLRCGVFSSMNREKRRFKKASAETVRALARSLGCQMEDLL
ncbi:MAG: helix-turn-helix domain-containing protein [Clostridium fessum]